MDRILWVKNQNQAATKVKIGFSEDLDDFKKQCARHFKLRNEAQEFEVCSFDEIPLDPGLNVSVIVQINTSTNPLLLKKVIPPVPPDVLSMPLQQTQIRYKDKILPSYMLQYKKTLKQRRKTMTSS